MAIKLKAKITIEFEYETSPNFYRDEGDYLTIDQIISIDKKNAEKNPVMFIGCLKSEVRKGTVEALINEVKDGGN